MSEAKHRYVLGFAFDGLMVLLVEKKKGPSINHGTLNGIGGKIENGETPEAAMVREFKEEAGCSARWTRIGRMFGDDWELDIFSGAVEGFETKKVNDVGERLSWEEVEAVIDPWRPGFYAQNVPTMVCHAIMGEGDLTINLSTPGGSDE